MSTPRVFRADLRGLDTHRLLVSDLRFGVGEGDARTNLRRHGGGGRRGQLPPPGRPECLPAWLLPLPAERYPEKSPPLPVPHPGQTPATPAAEAAVSAVPMRIACSLAARRPEPPMRPMIRLGNLNARPSCPAAAPGSTVWVYLYAAGHRDMPGDSPAGHRRCAGPGRRTGKLRTPVSKKSRRSRGAGGQHGVGQEFTPA